MNEQDVKEILNNRIQNDFKYHPPSEEQIEIYKKLRDYTRKTAEIYNQLCPTSREKSLAITKLEEAVMWANASIARN